MLFGEPSGNTPGIGVGASVLVSAVNCDLPKNERAQATPFSMSPPSLQSNKNPTFTGPNLIWLFQPKIKSGFGLPIALCTGSTAWKPY